MSHGVATRLPQTKTPKKRLSLISIVLAQGATGNSWLSRRGREYGDAPVAFILTAASGMEGSSSKWFGHSIVWADDAKLGWRLGFESF